MEGMKGKDIVGCFNTVNQLWREIELMVERLTILLRKEIKENGMRCEEGTGDGLEYAVFNEDYSDVCIGCIRNIAVKTPRKRTPDLHFGFQVSLADNLIDIPGNDEPLIFMFAVTEPMGFDAWHMAFPMSDDYDTDFKVENNVLLRWSDGSVAFGIRLLALNNEKDLLEQCVNPLMRLQKGDKAEVIFGNNPGDQIVKFPDHDALIS